MMKGMKRYINFMFATMLAAVVCSCELETSDNGKLDGMWHYVATDTLTSGTTEDVSAKRIYWSFQNNLLQFEDKGGANGRFLLRFEKSDNALRLHSPYIYDRENGDKVLEDAAQLAPFGMNALEETFTIERLDGGRMTLSTDKLRLHFKKM